MTVLMLCLSAQSGRLAARIGARLQKSAGPVVMAAGLVLLTLVTHGSSYPAHVLPGVVVFGLGTTIMVAPLTSTDRSGRRIPDRSADRRGAVRRRRAARRFHYRQPAAAPADTGDSAVRPVPALRSRCRAPDRQRR
jgi:hypothetical protein